MSSSTSNSDRTPRRRVLAAEIKVLLTVALVLLAVEAATRSLLRRLSKDDRHIAEIESISAHALRQPDPAVIFLGNSVTRCSIDGQTVAAKLARAGNADFHVEVIYPDGTALLSWLYCLKNRILSQRPAEARAVLYSYIAVMLLVFAPVETHEFIYFQF